MPTFILLMSLNTARYSSCYQCYDHRPIQKLNCFSLKLFRGRPRPRFQSSSQNKVWRRYGRCGALITLAQISKCMQSFRNTRNWGIYSTVHWQALYEAVIVTSFDGLCGDVCPHSIFLCWWLFYDLFEIRNLDWFLLNILGTVDYRFSFKLNWRLLLEE